MKSNLALCLFLCLLNFTKGMREVNIIDGNLVVNGSDAGTVRIIFVACKVPAQNTILFHDNCAPKLDGGSLSGVAGNFNQHSQDYTFGDFDIGTEEPSWERPMTYFGDFDKHSDYYLSYEITCPGEQCMSSFYVERMPVPGLPMPTPFLTPPPIPVRTPPPMEPTEKPTELPCLCDFEYEDGDTVMYSSDGEISVLRGMTGVVQCGTHMFDAVLVKFDEYTNGQNGGDNFCDCGDTDVERERSMDYVLCQDIDHVSCPQLNIEHSDREIDCANTQTLQLCDGGQIGCETGYQLNSQKPVISYCNNVGEWLEPLPECERIRCPSPEMDNSNSNTCNNTLSGELCQIECDHGYMFDRQIQQAPLYCNHDGTWSPLPQCIEDPCADVDCSQENPAGQCENQSVCDEGDCPANERSTGNACNDDDLHTIDDICLDGECIGTVNYCRQLDIPNSKTVCNLTHINTNCKTVNGEDQVLCIPGYRRNDAYPIPFCQEDGSWAHPLPECVEVPHCADLYIENSANDIDCTRNTEANIFCDLGPVECAEGFQLIPDEVPVCSHEGTWEDLPECVRVPCDVPSINNSNSAASSCEQKLSVGDTCEIVCDDGYEIRNSLDSITCQLGPEITSTPECEPIPCSSPEIQNSNSNICDNTEVDDECEISCDDDFHIDGHPTIRCELGPTWSHEPSCEDPCKDINCSELNPADQCETQMLCSEGRCPDNIPKSGPCNDNDPNTNDDTCEQGVCVGKDPCKYIDSPLHDTCDGDDCVQCTTGFTPGYRSNHRKPDNCLYAKEDVTHTEAKDFCEDNNSRLCTRTELFNDITAGTKCGFDFHLIWSSTECGDNHYCAEYGEQDDAGGTAVCLPQNRTHPNVGDNKKEEPTKLVVRCCKDSENAACRG